VPTSGSMPVERGRVQADRMRRALDCAFVRLARPADVLGARPTPLDWHEAGANIVKIATHEIGMKTTATICERAAGAPWRGLPGAAADHLHLDVSLGWRQPRSGRRLGRPAASHRANRLAAARSSRQTGVAFASSRTQLECNQAGARRECALGRLAHGRIGGSHRPPT
jgi:hypothetical protein